MTRKKQINNTSGVTGLSYDSLRNRWKAYITKNGISKYKCFLTKGEAIEWRKRQGDYYTKYKILF